MSFLSFHFKKTLIQSAIPVFIGLLACTVAITPVLAEEIPPADTAVSSEAVAPVNEASNAAPETTPTTETPAVVSTGDATAVATTETQANTNTTSTKPSPSEPSASETTSGGEVASSTPSSGSEADALSAHASSTPEISSGTASTTVVNANEAVVANAEGTGASTGGNSATGSGSAVITTGDATAVSNTVTVLNSNFFNSEGFFMFLVSLGLFGDLDLTHSIASSTLPASCGSGCNSETTSLSTVSNTNTATIVNDVIVRSSTGENSAEGNGTSTIQTGNAYAAANVVNVANTNIIDSNYLLLVFNNFGDWAGNLILPNKDFFENFFFKNQGNATSTGGSSNLSISNENQASVANNVATVADTGGNTASTTGESAIVTGNSSAGSSISNILNTNLFGGSNFRILLRIHGDWTGNITGLPNGISWMETPNGIELFGSGNSALGTAASSSSSGGTNSLAINNQNNASIQNNVEVYALTGDNKVSGGNGSIHTGSAYAAANVLNMANTNVIGQNWLTIILNVFGNWSGSIAFGQPDLWIGTRAESVGGTFGPNTQVRYHYTIANRGTAPATNVILTNTFVSPFISFNPPTDQPFVTHWNLGTIAPQTSIDVMYTALISDGIPHGELEMPSTATLVSNESDANPLDNTDTISILTDRPFPTEANLSIPLTPDPVLTVTKTTSATSPITASTTVNYSVTVKNTGGPAYHAVLVDDLVDEKGRKLAQHSWELGTIKPNEEIRVDYGVFFNAKAKNGTYTNRVQVHAIGRHESMDPFYGWFADSNVAAAMITILNPAPVVEEQAPIAETLDVAASTTPSVTTRNVVPPVKKVGLVPPAPPARPPVKTSFAFPPLRPFNFDGLTGNGTLLFQGQSAAAILGMPAIDLPRALNIFLLVLAGIFIVQNQIPFRKIKNAFTTFMW